MVSNSNRKVAHIVSLNYWRIIRLLAGVTEVRSQVPEAGRLRRSWCLVHHLDVRILVLSLGTWLPLFIEGISSFCDRLVWKGLVEFAGLWPSRYEWVQVDIATNAILRSSIHPIVIMLFFLHPIRVTRVHSETSFGVRVQVVPHLRMISWIFYCLNEIVTVLEKWVAAKWRPRLWIVTQEGRVWWKRGRQNMGAPGWRLILVVGDVGNLT